MMHSIRALLDCNNFFASCERKMDPALNGVPVAILSNNDGCIIARSQEVKDLGIAMGAPLFQVRDLVRQHGIRVFSANFALYMQISTDIMRLLKRSLPSVEVYSIDEAFMDLTGMQRFFDVERMMVELRAAVLDEVGIPVSIGLGPSKVLAKAANKLAKKSRGNYVRWLHEAADIRDVLQAMAVGDVWGVGHRNSKRMQQLGIQTAWDLHQASPKLIAKHFTIVEQRLHDELRGIPRLGLKETLPDKRQILYTRSFGQRLTQWPQIEEAIAEFATQAARKLRRQHSAARVVGAFIHTGRHDTQYYSRSNQVTLPSASADVPELVQAALGALKQVFVPGQRYYKGGVWLLGLEPQDSLQLSLLDSPQRIRRLLLNQVVDQVNDKLGTQKLQFSARLGGNKQYAQNRNYLSGHGPEDTGEVGSSFERPIVQFWF